MQPAVIRMGPLDMQVCVPARWTDAEVKEFADLENPSGLVRGWYIRTDPELLAGAPVRNPCSERDDYIHVMLDC